MTGRVTQRAASPAAAAAASARKVAGTAERPRISVFRSNRGIIAQLIDDERGHTLAAVNWTEAELRGLKAAEQAQARRRAAGAARARRPASSRASSIAAATATTAASRRSPRARARAASPSSSLDPSTAP